MNVRPIIALIALYILGIIVIYEGSDSLHSQQMSNQQGIAEIVYESRTKIDDLAMRVNKLEYAELRQDGTLAVRGEVIARLQTTVDTHEWILRGLLGAMMGLMIETGIRLFKKKV